MGRTHALAGGLFAAAIVPPASKALGLDFGPGELAIGVGIGVVAGLLPDIDHPNSMLTEGVVPGSKYLGPAGPALGYALSIPPRVIGVGARATMNHRGGTHSALFMVGWALLAAPFYAAFIAFGAFLLSVVLGALTSVVPGIPQIDPKEVVHWLIANVPKVMPLVMLSVFSGYLAHLVTDSMTKVPVPWPWPFSKGRWHILPKPFRITTDSFVETTLIRPLIALLFVAAVVINIGIPLGRQLIDEGKAVVQQHQEQTNKHPPPKGG